MARRACPRKSLVAALGMAILAGCTYVPDAFDPIAWYQSASDWLIGAESNPDSGPRSTGAREPVQNEAFPDINTVPDRARAMTSAAQRRAVMAGLVADRTNARYSPEVPPDYAPRPHTAQTPSPHNPEPEARKPLLPALLPPVTTQPLSPPPPVTQTAPPPVGDPVPTRHTEEESTLEEETVVIGGTALPNPGATGRRKGKGITPPSCHFCKTVPVAEGDGRAWETADRAERTPLPGEEVSSVLAFDTYSVGIPPAVYGTSYLVRSVPFASGSSTLSAEGRMKIREAVATLRQNGGRMRVVGYASSSHRDSGIARKAANLSLSLERANTVTRELARAGMKTEEVMVSALTTAASLRGLPDLPRADIYLDYDE